MRVFVTGATGFIGGGLARSLAGRGDQVVALVRSPEKATALRDLGCELVAGDLGDREAIASGLAGADAAVHAAAIYEVGVPTSRRAAIRAANVDGTRHVLSAAANAGTGRVVYVSTIAAYGNTRGAVVDETYEHPGSGFGSYYEETKVEAHRLAREFSARGLPLVIVQPGMVYGPGDHSDLGKALVRFARRRLPAMAFPDMGHTAAHVDDIVSGILLALDRGTPGEAYNLGGEITTVQRMLEAAAHVLGRRPITRSVPTAALRVIAPLGPVVGPLLGLPPNLRETISSADGFTYYGRHDKASAQLGYSARSLEQGLRETYAVEGLLA